MNFMAQQNPLRDFSVYLRGRLWAPVPMQNTLIFPNLTKKKIPNRKVNFSSF